VVVSVELDEAAVGNEAREQSALFDRHNRVTLGMHHQNRTGELAGALSHVGVHVYLKQPDRGIG
jgi:hypothetical protein